MKILNNIKMVIDNMSTIFFVFGIVLLNSVYIYLLKRGVMVGFLVNFLFVVSMVLLLVGWVVREMRERYYDYAYQDGKLVGGTVFTSYPDNVPGLGWI